MILSLSLSCLLPPFLQLHAIMEVCNKFCIVKSKDFILGENTWRCFSLLDIFASIKSFFLPLHVFWTPYFKTCLNYLKKHQCPNSLCIVYICQEEIWDWRKRQQKQKMLMMISKFSSLFSACCTLGCSRRNWFTWFHHLFAKACKLSINRPKYSWKCIFRCGIISVGCIDWVGPILYLHTNISVFALKYSTLNVSLFSAESPTCKIVLS